MSRMFLDVTVPGLLIWSLKNLLNHELRKENHSKKENELPEYIKTQKISQASVERPMDSKKANHKFIA